MQQSLEPSPRWGVGGQLQPRRQGRAQPKFKLAQSIGGHSTECGTDAEGRSVSQRDVECRTPDGRYLVVRGRLWRATNPHLPEAEKERLVTDLDGRAAAASRRALRGRSRRCARRRRRGQGCPRRARSGLVGRRRARLQSAPRGEHALRSLVCRSQGVCMTVMAAGPVQWR